MLRAFSRGDGGEGGQRVTQGHQQSQHTHTGQVNPNSPVRTDVKMQTESYAYGYPSAEWRRPATNDQRMTLIL